MLQDGMVTVLGTMSGTSLDGVDAAVITTDGVVVDSFGPSAYRAYDAAEQAVLRAALGQWPGGSDVAKAADVLEQAHIALMTQFDGVALAGFHGQTLAHDPGGRGTHQAGDGQRIADALGVPVAWDFRSADVAAGGQGAPLAPLYHFALAGWIRATEPVAFLNLGGVGNLTWVDPRCDAPDSSGALLAFDTGPANAPINDLMMARRGESHDAGGALAAAGVADATIVADIMVHPYFTRPVPKSLDRDAFAQLLPAVARLSDADAVATATAVAVASVIAGLSLCPASPSRLLVTGGGRHNAQLMRLLSAAAPMPVSAVEAVGLDGDMLEAQAFAYLAVRAARGLPLSAPTTTGVPNPLTGGRVSTPMK